MFALALALFSSPSFAGSLIDSWPSVAELPTVVVADAAVFELLDPDALDIMGFMHMAAGTQDALQTCRAPFVGEVVFQFEDGCVIEALLPTDAPMEPVSWNIVVPVPGDVDGLLGIGFGGPTALHLAVDATGDQPVVLGMLWERRDGEITACNFTYDVAGVETPEWRGDLIVAAVEADGYFALDLD